VTELNAVGDVVLTDPAAMRALASRLALHDELRRAGMATAEELAPLLGSDPEVVLRDLRALEEAGLAERRDESSWAVVGRGVFFEIRDDPEGESAARQLSSAMLLRYADVPRRWVEDDEARLTVEWARAAGLLNVGLDVTPDELRAIQSAFEDVLEPYLTRGEAPEEATRVRLLGYFMPVP
jgi:DNA-binding transcriptional ArsR family regulator